MTDPDIRWKQRFQNYEKALALLEEGLSIEQPDRTQRAGIIQIFEMCYELGWKLMKDYLEYQGYADIQGPRFAIKKAFEIGIVADGHTWLNLLNDRNLAAHVYDEEKAKELDTLIRTQYAPVLRALNLYYKSMNDAR